MRYEESVAIERILLDRVKMFVNCEVAKEHVLNGIDFHIFDNEMRHTFNIAALWDTLASQPQRVEYPLIHFEPASWWQLLKREHAPEWFVRRYPVATKQFTRLVMFSLREYYPELPIPPGVEQRVMAFAST